MGNTTCRCYSTFVSPISAKIVITCILVVRAFNSSQHITLLSYLFAKVIISLDTPKQIKVFLIQSVCLLVYQFVKLVARINICFEYA